MYGLCRVWRVVGSGSRVVVEMISITLLGHNILLLQVTHPCLGFSSETPFPNADLKNFLASNLKVLICSFLLWSCTLATISGVQLSYGFPFMHNFLPLTSNSQLISHLQWATFFRHLPFLTSSPCKNPVIVSSPPVDPSPLLALLTVSLWATTPLFLSCIFHSIMEKN